MALVEEPQRLNRRCSRHGKIQLLTCSDALVTSDFFLLVVMPGATSSFLLLVAMPFVTSSFPKILTSHLFHCNVFQSFQATVAVQHPLQKGGHACGLGTKGTDASPSQDLRSSSLKVYVRSENTPDGPTLFSPHPRWAFRPKASTKHRCWSRWTGAAFKPRWEPVTEMAGTRSNRSSARPSLLPSPGRYARLELRAPKARDRKDSKKVQKNHVPCELDE